MDILSINSDNGIYDIVIGEIAIKKIGYIIIKKGDNNTLNEAISLIKKYNPKRILFTFRNELNISYPCAYDMLEYEFEYELTKAYKEIKLISLELSNRDMMLNLINNATKNVSGSKTYNNHDIIELVNKKNSFYISYKKEYVGVVILNDDYIDVFAIDPKYQNKGIGKMAMSKLLYKCNKNMKLIVASDNKRAISFYEGCGFKYKGIYSSWYEVI